MMAADSAGDLGACRRNGSRDGIDARAPAFAGATIPGGRASEGGRSPPPEFPRPPDGVIGAAAVS